MVMGWQFAGWQWLALALTTPVVVWGGYPFHRAALLGIRHRTSTMDTLVSLGTLAAYLWSTAAVLRGAGPVYFEVAAAVTIFQLAGRYAEARAKRASGAALRSLLNLGAKDAVVLRGGDEVQVPVSQLQVDDVVVVRPGERLAADGVIIDGATALDASALTGEPVPVDVSAGDTVVGGSLNTYGRLLVRAARVGADTQLARMAELVSDAQNSKAPVQRMADRVAAIFVPAVLLIAATTMAGWLLAGQPAALAFTAAVAVLIVACPCALGLATPTAILVGTGRGAQLGILIKDPKLLETIEGVDTVVFDKTGTLTTGAMTVGDIEASTRRRRRPSCWPVRPRSSRHQSIRSREAIVAAARSRGLQIGSGPAQFVNDPGTGVVGVVDGVEVAVSRAGSLAGVDLLAPTRQTSVQVTWDGQVRGVITLVDQVKPDSAAAIAQLTAMGITPMLLTGDSAAAARHVAEQVGIAADDVIAGVLPTEKADAIKGFAGTGSNRGDGRRRRQRLGGACRRRHRHGDGQRRRRGDRRGRPHADAYRGAHRADRAATVGAHTADDPDEPVLGVRLQRGSDPAGRTGLAEPDDLRGGDGLLVAASRDKQPAAQAISALVSQDAARPVRSAAADANTPRRGRRA